MSRQALEPILTAIGLPAVNGAWAEDEVPVFPFVEYHVGGDADVIADNRVFRKVDVWALSVYGVLEDYSGYELAVDKVEEALNDIAYSRTPDIFPGGNEKTVFRTYRFCLPR